MSERQIIIEEVGKPKSPEPELQAGADLQDGLLAAGIVLAELATVAIWWPAALILGAIFCFGFAYLIEKAKRA